MERSVCFRNTKGYGLSGTILTPEGRSPYPVVVFSHGICSGKFSPRNLEVAHALRKKGIASFLFDFTGHGDSEGSLEEATIDQQVDDLGSAIDFLAEQSDMDLDRIGVSGSSTGGAAAVIRAAKDSRIKALVLRSPRADHAIKAAYLVSAPARIIVGERDRVVVEESKALLSALAGERLDSIKGAGHLFERPDQLKQAVELSVDWFVHKLGRAGVARAA